MKQDASYMQAACREHAGSIKAVTKDAQERRGQKAEKLRYNGNKFGFTLWGIVCLAHEKKKIIQNQTRVAVFAAADPWSDRKGICDKALQLWCYQNKVS